MKKIIYVIISILLLNITVGCGCTKKENETKVNLSENVMKEQTIESFIFKCTSLVYENNKSALKIKVTNTSEEAKELKKFNIHVKDSSEKEIAILTGYVGSSVEANSSITLLTSYDKDLTNASLIEYEIVE